MDDMMAAMFGGGMGGMGGGQRKRKGRDVGLALPATLEDLYNGKAISLPRQKQILCTTCKGKGSTKPGVDAKCSGCNGQGAKIVMRRMGPMVQQMQVPCDTCSGSGVKLDPKDACGACKGKRIDNVEAPLKTKIERGMEHNDRIPFRGEGDQSPDIDIPGDIVLVIQQIKHEKFVREENDLHMKQTIPLADALCGFQFVIEHLDGRKLVVQSEKGQMIKPGDKKVVQGEGMPIRGRPNQFGDLVIEFNVEFPTRLQSGEIEALSAVLPHGPEDTEYDHETAEVHYVNRTPLDEMRKELEREDDDDEDGQGGSGGPGGVQCAQQ